jgi:hypothetical protein
MGRLPISRIGCITSNRPRRIGTACDADLPIPHIIDVAQSLALRADRCVVYVSGRSDQCRGLTEAWLLVHGLPGGRLYMRKAGDRRDDDVVKGELLDQLRADGLEPIMAFDDRNHVVRMWRERGIPCAQVAEGGLLTQADKCGD